LSNKELDRQYRLDWLAQEYNVLDVIDLDIYFDSWFSVYYRLLKCRKESFDANDKIVFLYNSDYMVAEKTHGVILQSVITMLEQLDITNYFVCFVSSYLRFADDITKVLNDYSPSDDTGVFHFLTEGMFSKDTQPIEPFKGVPKDFDLATLENLTSEDIKLLFEHKSFCMAPWTSLMIGTDNRVKPCCLYKEDVGYSNEKSLELIWNDKPLQDLRLEMLNDKQPFACRTCHQNELLGKDSLRKTMNRQFSHVVNTVDTETSNGIVDEFRLRYLDSRFNNLCNLSCRMCGPTASSSWHAPAVELGIIAKSEPIFKSAGRTKDDLYKQVKTHIHDLEKIYFAGGEPLMIQEFYDIVKLLDQLGKHRVHLLYNTNLTIKTLNGQSVFDLWENFSNITICASLDGDNKQAEYLRSGTKWNDVVEFRKEMIDRRPDIDFYIRPTVSIINALHVPDFHKRWADAGLCDADKFDVTQVTGETRHRYLTLASAPNWLKDKIIAKYKEHIRWLKPLDPNQTAVRGYKALIKILEGSGVFDYNNFWDNVNKLDAYHSTKLLNVFPELEQLQKET